jgi:hypothetical protein
VPKGVVAKIRQARSIARGFQKIFVIEGVRSSGHSRNYRLAPINKLQRALYRELTAGFHFAYCPVNNIYDSMDWPVSVVFASLSPTRDINQTNKGKSILR